MNDEPTQSCIEHDPDHPSELVWAHELEPSQIDGMFWCFAGSHYLRASKEQLGQALKLLVEICAPVRA